MVTLFELRLFFFLGLRLVQLSNIGLFRRLVRLERLNFLGWDVGKLGQQNACGQMHREILRLDVRQFAGVNAQITDLAFKRTTDAFIADLQWCGGAEAASECIFRALHFQELSIHENRYARTFI